MGVRNAAVASGERERYSSREIDSSYCYLFLFNFRSRAGNRPQLSPWRSRAGVGVHAGSGGHGCLQRGFPEKAAASVC